MSAQTCPKAKCRALANANAEFCPVCGARLGLSRRQMRDMAKRALSEPGGSEDSVSLSVGSGPVRKAGLPPGSESAPRVLTKTLIAERPKRVYGQCNYCGRPCLGRTCAAHRKLQQLEHDMERGAA